MARGGRRAGQRHTKAIVLGTAVILMVLGVVAGVTFFMMTRSESLDKETLCPAKGPTGHYVLLVDKTDPLTFTQKEAFSVTLREIIGKRIPEGYLLSVFVLGEDFKTNAKPLVELCNPGTGQGKSALTANLKQLNKIYQDGFLGPLLKQSEAMMATQPSKMSPIFEMMQLVSINGLRKHDIKGERRLIVMSDMLHNTSQFSMYKGPVDYPSFASSTYGQKSQLELKDVEVEIHYLMNTPQLQTKRSLKFWEDYFNKAGARIVTVRPLEG
jgi:hypothetical protein